MTSRLLCIGTPYHTCTELATWMRYTQFSGNHPFCDKHARSEEDFGVTDDYQDWEPIEDK